MNKEFIIIIVTCGSGKEARAIANYLLEERLVACANIMPGVQSKFWWEGRIDHQEEVVMFLKTRGCNFSQVERQIKRFHSYDVPEIVAVPVIKGSRPYLNWLKQTVKKCRDS